MDDLDEMIMRGVTSMEIYAEDDEKINVVYWRCWRNAWARGEKYTPAEFKALPREEILKWNN